MEIYRKLQACRREIKDTKLKKEGKNTFSNYSYFTPSQVEKLVFDVCVKYALFCKFDLLRTDLGLVGQLLIISVENPEEKLLFTMATDIPEIKATNIAQQLGGTMTYTERYLKMTAFGIEDNTLDFDGQDNSKKEVKKETKKEIPANEKPWLNKFTDKSETTITENYAKVLKAMAEGYTIKQVREKYKVSNDIAKLLSNDIDNII